MCCVAALPLLHGGHACAGLRWHDAQPPRRRRIQICTRWEQRYAGDLQARARARRVLAHSNKRQRTRRAVGEIGSHASCACWSKAEQGGSGGQGNGGLGRERMEICIGAACGAAQQHTRTHRGGLKC